MKEAPQRRKKSEGRKKQTKTKPKPTNLASEPCPMRPLSARNESKLQKGKRRRAAQRRCFPSRPPDKLRDPGRRSSPDDPHSHACAAVKHPLAAQQHIGAAGGDSKMWLDGVQMTPRNQFLKKQGHSSKHVGTLRHDSRHSTHEALRGVQTVYPFECEGFAARVSEATINWF